MSNTIKYPHMVMNRFKLEHGFQGYWRYVYYSNLQKNRQVDIPIPNQWWNQPLLQPFWGFLGRGWHPACCIKSSELWCGTRKDDTLCAASATANDMAPSQPAPGGEGVGPSPTVETTNQWCWLEESDNAGYLLPNLMDSDHCPNLNMLCWWVYMAISQLSSLGDQIWCTVDWPTVYEEAFPAPNTLLQSLEADCMEDYIGAHSFIKLHGPWRRVIP